MLRGENIFPKNMISRGPVYIIYAKTDSTVKNREYAFAKTFESVFDEDTFFNSCLLCTSCTTTIETKILEDFVSLVIMYGTQLKGED